MEPTMCAQKSFRIVTDERLLYVSHSPSFWFGGTVTAILPCKMAGKGRADAFVSLQKGRRNRLTEHWIPSGLWWLIRTLGRSVHSECGKKNELLNDWWPRGFFFFSCLLLPNQPASSDQCCHLVIFYFFHITLVAWGCVWKARGNI